MMTVAILTKQRSLAIPLYQYTCDQCSHTEEVLQSIKEMETGIDTPGNHECGGKFVRILGHASIGLCDTNLCRDALKTRNDFDDPMDDRGQLYAAMAKKAGVSTTGKFYLPALATHLGDVEAWVSGMDDVKNVCKRRGWTFAVADGEMKIGIPADLSKPIDQQTVASKLGA